MNSEGHVSFATDPWCDLREVTHFARLLSHCETYTTHLQGLAESPIRLESLCQAHSVGPEMVLPVTASGCPKPAWDSQPLGVGAKTLWEAQVCKYKADGLSLLTPPCIHSPGGKFPVSILWNSKLKNAIRKDWAHCSKDLKVGQSVKGSEQNRDGGCICQSPLEKQNQWDMYTYVYIWFI